MYSGNLELFRDTTSSIYVMVKLNCWARRIYLFYLFGLAKRCVKHSPFFWTVFILDLALSYTDKFWAFRWVLTMLPLLQIYFCFTMKEISCCLRKRISLKLSTEQLDI